MPTAKLRQSRSSRTRDASRKRQAGVAHEIEARRRSIYPTCLRVRREAGSARTPFQGALVDHQPHRFRPALGWPLRKIRTFCNSIHMTDFSNSKGLSPSRGASLQPRAAVDAARAGFPPHRRLSPAERLAAALLRYASPTHHLTLHGAGLGRKELQRAWEHLRKRLARERPSVGLPLYIGTAVRASGADGWHMHLLLWNYVHAPVLHKHVRELGLGSGHIERIPSPEIDPGGALTRIAYVLGQEEPVFGSRHDRRHDDRVAGNHRLLKPQMATLQQRAPGIFAALQAAKDPDVTDETLWFAMSRSSKKDEEEWTQQSDGPEEADPDQDLDAHDPQVGLPTYPDLSTSLEGSARSDVNLEFSKLTQPDGPNPQPDPKVCDCGRGLEWEQSVEDEDSRLAVCECGRIHHADPGQDLKAFLLGPRPLKVEAAPWMRAFLILDRLKGTVGWSPVKLSCWSCQRSELIFKFDFWPIADPGYVELCLSCGAATVRSHPGASHENVLQGSDWAGLDPAIVSLRRGVRRSIELDELVEERGIDALADIIDGFETSSEEDSDEPDVMSD